MYLEPKKNSGVNDIQKVILGFFDLYFSEQSAQLEEMGLQTIRYQLKPTDKTAQFYLAFIKQNFEPCIESDNKSYSFPTSQNYSVSLYNLELEFRNGYNNDLYKFVQAIRIASES